MAVQEQLNTCCFKALKHGENVCPVCGNVLYGYIQKCTSNQHTK